MNTSNLSALGFLLLVPLVACETNVDALGPSEAPGAADSGVDADASATNPRDGGALDGGTGSTDAGSADAAIDPCEELDTIVEAGGQAVGFYADTPLLLAASETRVAVGELIPDSIVMWPDRQHGPRLATWHWTGALHAETYPLDDAQTYFEVAANPGGCPFALFAQDRQFLRMDLVGPFCGSHLESVANDADVMAPIISDSDLFFVSSSRSADELTAHVRRGDSMTSSPVTNQPAEDVHVVPLGFITLEPPAIPREPVVIYRLRTSTTQIAAVRPDINGQPQLEYHAACADQELDVASDGLGIVYAVGRCSGQVILSTFYLNDACEECPPAVETIVGASSSGPAPRVAYDGRRVAVAYWNESDATPTVRFFDRQGAARAAGGLSMANRFVGQPQMITAPTDLAISGYRGQWAVAFSYDVPDPLAGGTLARFRECEVK